MATIYPGETWVQILILTGVFGGGCAWQTGRAIALTWRPGWHVPAAMILLGLAVRFFHFALMDSPLWSPAAFAADTAFLMVVAGLAFRHTRMSQMTRQYYWLFERRGPFAWRRRGPSAEPNTAGNV